MEYLTHIFLFSCGFPLIYFTHGWTYHSSLSKMSYDDAQTYCRHKYTDMVAIQNQEENKYLNENLPFNSAYYWIGIRKNNGKWTWVGTNKVLTEEAENWAENEPNNKSEKKNEDCVEMYVKRTIDAGKWNDEPCSKKKVALCFKASCHPSSCNHHGECIETINDYSCKCSDGFFGKDCEHVVICPEINGIDHGSVVCSNVYGNFTYQSSCHFTCSDGHLLTGSANLQCNEKGDWGSEIPRCKAIECKHPEQPENGVMTCSNEGEILPENSNCNFSCQEGFTMVGSSSVFCITPGQWSENSPRCEAIQCERPAAQENGEIDCSSNEEMLPYNATCNFICNEGFILVGDPSIHCVTPGQWDAESPKCEAIQCEDPEQPENGSMISSSSEEVSPYNSTCHFICDEGFTMVGSPSIQCSATGQWTEDPPKCEAIQCEHPEQPENGSMICSSNEEMSLYKSTCHFICDEGFTMVGSPSIQCSATGQWTDNPPKCEAIQCEHPKQPENGTMICSSSEEASLYNSTCHFICDEGFTMVGSPSIQCSATGQWTDNPPKCEAIQCEHPKQPENGTMICSSSEEASLYKSTCHFICDEGFTMVGSPSIQCSATGQWTDNRPKCEAVQCNTLVAPSMGKMNCSHIDFGYGTVCKFTCEYDLLLNGTDILECDKNGSWNTEAPTCEAVKVPHDAATYQTVGIVTSVASVLSTASLIIWLIKRMRKTAKKFTPTNSYQHLEAAGVYQNTEDSWEGV
ncbi:E-selectin-like [Rhinoderma darwinii]|uniref:E-selectin-like n=1 Tax=Rhinoderma darwinii TaxID=43563 RepID=UPI003F66545C